MKESRQKNYNSFSPVGWKQHTPYHWTRMIGDDRLDFWPSTLKTYFKGTYEAWTIGPLRNWLNEIILEEGTKMPEEEIKNLQETIETLMRVNDDGKHDLAIAYLKNAITRMNFPNAIGNLEKIIEKEH